MKFGRGPAEITDLQSSNSAAEASISYCVQYPTLVFPKKYQYVASQNLLTGATSYKRRKLDSFARCPGTMGPFPELDQVGQKLRECKANVERRCVVNVEPNRRDILVVD